MCRFATDEVFSIRPLNLIIRILQLDTTPISARFTFFVLFGVLGRGLAGRTDRFIEPQVDPFRVRYVQVARPLHKTALDQVLRLIVVATLLILNISLRCHGSAVAK